MIAPEVIRTPKLLPRLGFALALLCGWLPAHALEHVTLANGFELDCVRQERLGDVVRLYLTSGTGENYMEVAASAIIRVETWPDPPKPVPAVAAAAKSDASLAVQPTPAELTQMLAHAGVEHNIDADLLAAVVHAESGGRAHAVSRAGARGLMQLMPGTASALGVTDTFVPVENVEGGTKYLDQMLLRYHDSMALALAAYNAGPGAVDRYHGVPPYRETRAYVARIIREFNQRKLRLLASAKTTAVAGR